MKNNKEKLKNVTEDLMGRGNHGDIAKSLSEVKETVTEKSQKMAQNSVDYAKKHSIKTAIGAGVVGFATGYAVKQFRD